MTSNPYSIYLSWYLLLSSFHSELGLTRFQKRQDDVQKNIFFFEAVGETDYRLRQYAGPAFAMGCAHTLRQPLEGCPPARPAPTHRTRNPTFLTANPLHSTGDFPVFTFAPSFVPPHFVSQTARSCTMVTCVITGMAELIKRERCHVFRTSKRRITSPRAR